MNEDDFVARMITVVNRLNERIQRLAELDALVLQKINALRF